MTTDDRDGFLERFLRTIKASSAAEMRAWLEKTGIGKGTAQTLLSGGLPSAEKLIAIASETGVSIDWLLGVDATATAELGQIKQAAPSDTDEFVYIPRYDVAASAGSGSYVDNEQPRFTMAFRRYWITNHLHANPKDLSVITVKGDSMEPVLKDGDNILVHHADADRADGIYVLRLEDRIVVKRTLWLAQHRVRIISDNAKAYPPYEVDGSDDNDFDFEVIGRVVWFGRQI